MDFCESLALEMAQSGLNTLYAVIRGIQSETWGTEMKKLVDVYWFSEGVEDLGRGHSQSVMTRAIPADMNQP
jgi:hypothetical protein